MPVKGGRRLFQRQCTYREITPAVIICKAVMHTVSRRAESVPAQWICKCEEQGADKDDISPKPSMSASFFNVSSAIPIMHSNEAISSLREGRDAKAARADRGTKHHIGSGRNDSYSALNTSSQRFEKANARKQKHPCHDRRPIVARSSLRAFPADQQWKNSSPYKTYHHDIKRRQRIQRSVGSDETASQTTVITNQYHLYIFFIIHPHWSTSYHSLFAAASILYQEI